MGCCLGSAGLTDGPWALLPWGCAAANDVARPTVPASATARQIVFIRQFICTRHLLLAVAGTGGTTAASEPPATPPGRSPGCGSDQVAGGISSRTHSLALSNSTLRSKPGQNRAYLHRAGANAPLLTSYLKLAGLTNPTG